MRRHRRKWGHATHRSSRLWQFAPVGVVGPLLAILGCGTVVDTETTGDVASKSAQPIIEVQVERVRRGSIGHRIFAPASLVARRVSEIGAEVPGRIQEVFVRSGDRVELDAPLFRIDPKPYEAASRRAAAGLDLARSERLQIAADLDRLKVLRSDGIGSQSDLDRAHTALAIGLARERQAKEAVAMAQLDLKRTLVTAPYAGSIAERRADEGTTALAQPQTIVVVIHETIELEARADVAERQLSVVRIGDPALVHIEGLAEPIRTQVDSVADTIDPATRTYRVKMRISNLDHRLKSGIFARIEIQPAEKRDVLLVSRAAIRSEAAHTQVLTVVDGRVVAIPVRLGLVSDADAEIMTGVELGTPVIVGKAAQELSPEMRVRVVESEPGRGSPS
jgi:RND family efflux transporter MFP subunit